MQEAFICAHFCQPLPFDFKDKIFLGIGALNDKWHKSLLCNSATRIRRVQFLMERGSVVLQNYVYGNVSTTDTIG